MGKTFNELFDDFFKRNNINPDDKIDETTKNELKKIIDMLNTSSELPNITGEEEAMFDETLGRPDKIECYNDGNLFFEKRTWYTPKGQLVKLIVTDEPTMKLEPPKRKTLEEKLGIAVENEEFEKAAAIRDLIKKEKKIKK